MSPESGGVTRADDVGRDRRMAGRQIGAIVLVAVVG